MAQVEAASRWRAPYVTWRDVTRNKNIPEDSKWRTEAQISSRHKTSYRCSGKDKKRWTAVILWPAASEGISLEYLSNILATSRRLFSFQFSHNSNAGFHTTYYIYRLLFRWGLCRSHVFEVDSHFRQTLVSLLLGSTSLPYYPRGKFDFHVRTISSYYQLFTWSLCNLLTFLFVVGFPVGFPCCLLNHIPKEPFSLKLIPYLQTLTHNKILHSAWHLLILYNYYQ